MSLLLEPFDSIILPYAILDLWKGKVSCPMKRIIIACLTLLLAAASILCPAPENDEVLYISIKPGEETLTVSWDEVKGATNYTLLRTDCSRLDRGHVIYRCGNWIWLYFSCGIQVCEEGKQ